MNSPRLKGQRDRDHDTGGLRTYYHWVMNGSIDFISLDNASGNTFDPEQMSWVRTRLAEDRKSSAISTVVAGMHEALPGSKGMSHRMCDSACRHHQRARRLQSAGGSARRREESVLYSQATRILSWTMFTTRGKTPDSLVHWCYSENNDQTIPAPRACATVP